MDNYRLIEIEEDQEDFVDEEEEYEEKEEVEELIPLEMIIPSDSFENADYDDDDVVEEVYEEEAVEDLTLVGLSSQGAAVINDGLLDDSNNPQLCKEKPETGEGEIGGLFCPICFKAWTNGGEHRICCLPCGHIYRISCINKWLQRSPNSKKCPRCNSLCTLQDVIVLYTAGLCVADEKLQNKVLSHEAKCASLEQQTRDFQTQRQHVMMHVENIETSFKRHEKVEMYIRKMERHIKEMEVRGYK